MRFSQILNKTITIVVLVGVVFISIPQSSNAESAELKALSDAASKINTSSNQTPAQIDAARAEVSRLQKQADALLLKRQQEAAVIRNNTTTSQDPQAEAFGGTTGTTEATGSATGATSDALGCSAGALLGQAISTGLKTVVNKAVGKVVGALTTVPISANTVGDNIDRGANAADADASMNAFQQIFGVPFGASFNAIGWCIVNGLITYIADSTIAWANSGFQGNPAFLENPEAFFTTLADRQASEFISTLAYDTTGINVCEPFRVELAIALAESYGTQQGGNTSRFSCSMDQVSQNFMDFANGGGGYGYGEGGPNIDGYWSNWNQLRQDQNNPWGAYIEAGEYLRAQISVKENTAKFELGLNAGYLNFKKCEDPADAKKGDGDSCRTYTPGSLIQSSLEDTLKIPKERLVAADKIDQVITALANALIKKALNTVLESN